MRHILVPFLTFSILISTSFQTYAEVDPEVKPDVTLEVRTEQNKEVYITKRTAISENTLLYADTILNGELFVSPIYPAYKVTAPITWKEDPYKNTTWRLYYQSMNALSYLTNAYEVTNDSKYLSYGFNMIQSFWKVNYSPEVATDKKYTYESHAMANRTNNLMYFYHYYINSPIATESNIKYLNIILRKHGVALNDPTLYNYRSNHGIFQDRALIQLASYFPEITTSMEWKKNAIYRTKQHIIQDFTAEGLHKEHSPLYFTLVMDLIEDINKIADDPELRQLVLKGQNAFANLVLSDFRLPGLGDSDYANAPIKSNYSVLDPEFEYVLTRGQSGKQPKLVSNLSNSLVVVRDGWGANTTSLVFAASNFSVVHKHADDLSFLLSQNGQDIFIDSGKYNYNRREAIQQYLRTTFAHNVVTVDGKSYPISIDNVGKTKITNVIDNQDSVIMTGEHTIYSGVQVYRTIVYLKEKKVALIQDEILSNTEHVTNQVFNIGKNINTQSVDSNTVLVNDSITMKQHKPALLKEYFGQLEPLRGFASTSFNQSFPIKQLDFESKGKNIQYYTSISTTPTIVSDFTLNEDQYKISLSDGTNYIVTKPITTPFVNEISDKTLKVTGFTQGGADVSVLYGSSIIGKGKANLTGNYSVNIPKQLAGRKLTIVATSKNKLYKASTYTIVNDVTPPVMPTINSVNSTTKLLFGNTEKYVTVVVKIGKKTYTTRSNSKGNYQIKIPTNKKGTIIQVYAQDKIENRSSTRSVKVQ